MNHQVSSTNWTTFVESSNWRPGKKIVVRKNNIERKRAVYQETSWLWVYSGSFRWRHRDIGHWHRIFDTVKAKKQTQCEDSMLEDIVGWSQMNVQNISLGRQHETMQEIHPLQCLLKLEVNRKKIFTKYSSLIWTASSPKEMASSTQLDKVRRVFSKYFSHLPSLFLLSS